MPFSLFIGALTLVPALAAILIAGLGAARRALAPAVFVLCALGALVPVVCLLILAPYLGSGEPLRVTLFGGSLAATAWFSAVYRIDAFGVYTGLGLTILVVPLLLWMAWKGRLAPAAPVEMELEIVEAEDADTDADADADTEDESVAPVVRSMLPVTSWAGVALTLAAETAALTVLFADNILWLALAWLVLAALVWGIGELGAEAVDRTGLVVVLVGPVLWAAIMLFGAVPAKSPTFFALMGRGAYSPIQAVLLALVIALAGGAYPFLAWVRRRAALATPAGLGALLLVLLPIVLFAAARTYGAAVDASGQWSEIGQAAPPIYGGIAWAVLGTVTVAVCGLLALERRDNRTLLAYLAVAQIGWGMLALSTGDPASLAGFALLLAGSVFGLGAMLAASFAGATLTDDEEPDGAGPRAFGTRFSPASLFAWCVGAVSLIGVPLFGGFAARELISAAALHLGNLTVPLVGVAWAGDALLGLALLRATAPAFTQLLADTDDAGIEDGEEQTLAAVAADATPDEEDVAEDMDDEEDMDAEDLDEADRKAAIGARRAWRADIRALPALIFGLLAVALGIAPHALLAFGGTLAAGTLAPSHAVDRALRTSTVGIGTGFGQWLPGIAWGALVVLALLFTFTRPDSLRVARLPRTSDQTVGEADGLERAPELSGQPEPVETWQDLSAVFVSPITLPAGAWLLADAEATEDAEDTETVETLDDTADETPDETAAAVVPEPEPAPVEAAGTDAAPAAGAVAASDASANAEDGEEDEEEDAPPANTTLGTADGTGSAKSVDAPTRPAQVTKADPAAKPATSQSATSTAKPDNAAAKPGGAAAKPGAAGLATPKPAPVSPNTKPNASTGSAAKPATGKPNPPAPAKGTKAGGKKHPGGRA